MTIVPFARTTKPDAEGYSGERLVNYFLRPSDGFAPLALLGRSGLVPSVNLGGPVRAMIDNNGTLLALANWRLWSIVDGIATDLGPVADDPKAIMAASGSQVAIVADGRYFLWDGNAVSTPDTGALSEPVGVTYQDGYFILAGTIAGRKDGFTISAIDDGKTFDALDFAFAEGSPDGLVSIISDHAQVYAFGNATTEVFYNSGNAVFPFEPNRSSAITRGVSSGRTIAAEDNALFWVGQDNIVYRYGGGSPEVISTREIEDTLSRSVVVSGFCFSDRGHKFYCIRREGDTAFCFDIATRTWSERSTGGGGWIATAAAMVNGKQWIGTETGAVCSFDPLTFTDDGTLFISEAISVPVFQGNRFTVGEMFLTLETGDVAMPDVPVPTDLWDYDGVGIVDADGVPILVSDMVEPQGQIMMQTTKDGRTWSRERWRGMGRRGQYNHRITWNGLGQFRRFQVKVRISDPVKRDIYGVQFV